MAWLRRNRERRDEKPSPPAESLASPPGPQTPIAKQASPSPPAPEWNLDQLATAVARAAADLESWTVDAALVEARLADCYRDVRREPLPHSLFAQRVAGLDEPAWRRLAVAVWTLDDADLRNALAHLTTPVEHQVTQGFLRVARETDVLTLELLAGSETRAEEFGRHFAAHLGVNIAGEPPPLSAWKRQQLDYRRLLEDARTARETAEEQLEYLRQLQEAQDNRRRRGKW